MERVVGLDIGGANVKACHADGRTAHRPFALWRHPEQLQGVLEEVLGRMPAHDVLAVTMTGELCDCFPTKREGVRFILDSLLAAAPGKDVAVWTYQGRFVSVASALENPLAVASANWLALACLAGGYVGRSAALLIDIGSTTTDLVPLWNGEPMPRGRTDPERLTSGELVYCGARRTPVMAILGLQGAAELFATMHDVYLVLGWTEEDAEDRDTADGRPATRELALDRLARMLCADRETASAADIHRLAEKVAQLQRKHLAEKMQLVAGTLPGPVQGVVLAGSGEFLARRILAEDQPLGRVRLVSLAEELGPEASRAACAYAVARLRGRESFFAAHGGGFALP